MLPGGISRAAFIASMVSSLEEEQSLKHELIDTKVEKLSAAARTLLDEVRVERRLNIHTLLIRDETHETCVM